MKTKRRKTVGERVLEQIARNQEKVANVLANEARERELHRFDWLTVDAPTREKMREQAQCKRR
jgi:hypothetical protein